MPDEELLGLAVRGELRKNLIAQVTRMLADARSEKLVQNFTGQWLQTRDVEGISIDARVVLGTALVNGNGMAKFNTASLGLGKHFITATYSGCSTFRGSSSDVFNVTMT